jgi:hypothetical protein
MGFFMLRIVKAVIQVIGSNFATASRRDVLEIGTLSTNRMDFKPNDSTAMSIINGGNVGIGITAPGNALDIVGVASTTEHIFAGMGLFASSTLLVDSDATFGGYASSTTGLWTQGTLHVGSTVTLDGTVTSTATVDASQFCISGANCITAWPGGTPYNEFYQSGDNQRNVSTTPFLFAEGLYASTTVLLANATITDTLAIGGYTSSTGGIWTQGALHTGGALTVDGTSNFVGAVTVPADSISDDELDEAATFEWTALHTFTDARPAVLNASTTLIGSGTTTDSFYIGGLASSTVGIWTQGTLHVGSTITFDGTVTSTATVDASQFCIGGADCITSWPGGSSPYTEFESVGDNQEPVSTTPFLFDNGLYASTTVLFEFATITDSFYVGGYASTTGGIWTQGDLHVGDDLTLDGSGTTTETFYVAGGLWVATSSPFAGTKLAVTGDTVIDGSATSTNHFAADGTFYVKDGLVGIGDESPDFDFHVYGTNNTPAAFEGDDHAIIRIIGTDGSEKSINFYESTTLAWKVGMDNTPSAGGEDEFFSIKQTNNGTPEFMIDTSGNVSIEGNASTTGSLVVGTGLGALSLSAGDLFVSNDATVTAALAVGSNLKIVDFGAASLVSNLSGGNITFHTPGSFVQTNQDLIVGGKVTTTGKITPAANATHDLGVHDYYWNDLWVDDVKFRAVNGGGIRFWNGSANYQIYMSNADGDLGDLTGSDDYSITFKMTDTATRGFRWTNGNETGMALQSVTGDWDLWLRDDLHIGQHAANDNDYLYFDQDNENIGWIDANTEFVFSDDVQVLSLGINISAQSGYGLWVSHDGTNDALTVDTSGIVYSDTTYDNTSASAANVYIDAEGELYRSTASARKYKTDIDYQGVDGDLVYQLQPASFKEKRTGQEFIGFIAEDVAEVDPRLVLFDEEGNPDALQYAHFTSLLAKAIQDLKIEVNNLKAETTTSTESLTVVDNPDLDIETLVVQQAATFYGTLYVKGEAGFEHKVVFNEDIEVKGKIYGSKDQAGTAIIPAQATSTEIIFEGEYEVVPKVAVSLQDVKPIFYGIKNKSVAGFKIVLAQPFVEDLTFDWITLAVKTNGEQPQPVGEPPIIENLLISRTEVQANEEVEFWALVNDSDTTGAFLNYSWTISPGVGNLSNDSAKVYWTATETEFDTELIITVTVSDGINSVSESGTLTLLGTSQEEPPIEEPPEPIIVLGCIDELALNYNPEATEDDGTCEYEVVQETPTTTEPIVILGCLDETALNYDPEATEDDGSCEYEVVQEETTTTTEEVVIEDIPDGVGGPEEELD